MRERERTGEVHDRGAGRDREVSVGEASEPDNHKLV